ncbi:hypothetical protein HYU19_03340 [Candidatus Woesearchaeota archaeon]|nr:hypothetical protein [Candidatus Woesearchaeota archaeon]
MYDIVIGRSEADKQKYGTAGTILLGKQYVTMGRQTSLASPVYLDIASSHVIFVCGKRGSGKCLEGDTLITLHDGSIKPIRELYPDDHDILALDTSLKLNIARKEGFYQRHAPKLFHIYLRTGKELKLTPEHPLLTVNGWKPVQELPVGSRIATPRVIPIFGEEDLSEDKVKLLAYLLAEGHLSNKFVLFSNMDEQIIDDFKNAVRSFDAQLEVKQHSKPGCFRVVNLVQKRKIKIPSKRNILGQFCSGPIFEDTRRSIRKWFDDIHLYWKLSKEKFIPGLVFKLPKAKLALFLNRLFSCDGSIYCRDSYWQVSYASASAEMIKQVQHLLLRFEIVSRVREKHWKQFTHYEIEIDSENVSRFLQNIGFFGKKEERQARSLREGISIRRNPNKDTIPQEIWDTYRPSNWAEIGRKMGYSTPKALRSSIAYAPSRQKLLQIATLDGQEQLQMLASSDIYWDEIVQIKELDGDFLVYDITVPNHHNFVANDILVHNSYSMGAIAEGMTDISPEIRDNLSFILLDTMGIYWTMKYPNKEDEDSLKAWGFKPKALNVRIFTPVMYHQKYKDEGIPTDFPFSINPSDLDPEDWQLTFDISPNHPMGVLLERVIYQLKSEGKPFSISDIIKEAQKDMKTDQATKDAVENRFLSAKTWGVFADHGEGTPLGQLAAAGQVSVLDVSCYATMPNGWKIKHVIVGIISKALFIQRMSARKKEEYDEVHAAIHYFSDEGKQKKLPMPLVWLVLDEAHEFLPNEGKNPATQPLITIMREGRQPGISLILASQQPGKIHTDVMTQSDTVLSHRVTAKLDVDALGMLMQSYMREGLTTHIDGLPRLKGAAVLFDDTNERLYSIQVRPRFTWHGGSAPVAITKPREKL